MLDREELINRVLYLLHSSDKSLRRSFQVKLFRKLFEEDAEAKFIVNEFFNWFKQYDTLPSLQRIFEKHKATSWGPRLKIRFKIMLDLAKASSPPTEAEFDSYVNDLKTFYAREEFSKRLQGFSEVEAASKGKTLEEFTEFIRTFGKGFIEISNNLDSGDEGEYSYTTHDAHDNVGKIMERDLSNEKRFNIGHRVVDEATKGFKYGDLLMVLGNINQGKSMALVNICYNMWKDGHNVLLLTAEMRPDHFDERIYSRASAVDYSRIMSGKRHLDKEDGEALEECVKMMNGRKNHIITKFLKPTDNVATIEGYINDLRNSKNFIPDVVVIDSLEHISPLYVPTEEKDWQVKGQIITEFKNWAETFMNNRGVFVISTHQAKSETHNKKFNEISITDFGRSKIVPEKADFSLYIRTISELNIMNVKLIKARRCQVGLDWSMAVDYSKCLISDTDDTTNSESILDNAD